MITLKVALDIKKTMFCSIIDYGNICISALNDSDLKDVQTMQNHAIRCCYNIKTPRDVHISDLHKEANIIMVDTRRKRQILTCIWRNIEKGVIEIAKPVRETRQNIAPSIYLPAPKTKLFKKLVYYQGATLWNSLPSDTRLSDDIEVFKLRLYKIIKD